MRDTSRRSVMTGLMAGAFVLGLDPVTRTWVTSASADGPLDHLPKLDGRLRIDAAALEAAAEDFGHVVHRTPLAVLEPGSVQDVVKMVRFCRKHGLKVAGRGQGHTTNGQAQVAGGLVIDLGTLNDIQITGDRATVGAGAKWSAVLNASLPSGLTPPVLTDYIELSVGGTLSVGGLGGQIGHHGAQVDTALELEVVTGKGKRVTCSRRRKADVFYAVLAGLGQCGIIVKATIKLVPAPTTVRVYNLFYPSVAALTAAQLRMVDEKRFSYLEGQLQSSETGWKYMMEAVAYDATAADDDRLTDGLGHTSFTATDQGYYEFADRIGPIVEILKAIGEWTRPHVWLDSLLPASATNELVEGVLPTLSPQTIGLSAVILLYPIPTHLLQAPLLRMPSERHAFLFSLLKTSSPGSDDPAAMAAANRAFYEQLRARGGGWYPVGTVPLTTADWSAHYGPVWPFFEAARHTHDPDNILTPGQGIFA